jgi:hypothetical protein
MAIMEIFNPKANYRAGHSLRSQCAIPVWSGKVRGGHPETTVENVDERSFVRFSKLIVTISSRRQALIAGWPKREVSIQRCREKRQPYAFQTRHCEQRDS